MVALKSSSQPTRANTITRYLTATRLTVHSPIRLSDPRAPEKPTTQYRGVRMHPSCPNRNTLSYKAVYDSSKEVTSPHEDTPPGPQRHKPPQHAPKPHPPKGQNNPPNHRRKVTQVGRAGRHQRVSRHPQSPLSANGVGSEETPRPGSAACNQTSSRGCPTETLRTETSSSPLRSAGSRSSLASGGGPG